jgi:uncharacterized iron-regulated membrane protein
MKEGLIVAILTNEAQAITISERKRGLSFIDSIIYGMIAGVIALLIVLSGLTIWFKQVAEKRIEISTRRNNAQDHRITVVETQVIEQFRAINSSEQKIKMWVNENMVRPHNAMSKRLDQIAIALNQNNAKLNELLALNYRDNNTDS